MTYWAEMSPEEWAEEMVGIRKMIGQFANIDPCEVRGTRAPFLQGGGDDMFQMLSENNFKYDRSWPTRQFGYVDAETGLYPYTLDYPSKQVRRLSTELSQSSPHISRTVPSSLVPSARGQVSGSSP